MTSDATPIVPTRVYGELRARLARDAIVIGDGGDFVSYAGKYVDTFTPGCFLGPGPYGCLGSGIGYALGAALAHPTRQVVALLGDGAVGFSLGDLDSLARHRANVTLVVGNNGIWGLEKHPMVSLFGYDVICDLAPETRYDRVAVDLGCHGELVADTVRARPGAGSARSRTTAPRSSTCSPTPPTPTPERATSPDPRTHPASAGHAAGPQVSSQRGGAIRRRVARSRNRSRSTTTRVIRPAPDQAPGVGHRDPEREPPALDRLEDGLGLDLVADRHRRQVVDLDAVADRRRPLRQLTLDRPHGRLLDERDQARGREHGDVAGAQRDRGVGLTDDERDDGAQAGLQPHTCEPIQRARPVWDSPVGRPDGHAGNSGAVDGGRNVT